MDAQTAATGQIVTSIVASAAGVSNSIGRVADTTTLTHEAATQTEAGAVELSQLSQQLRMVSDKFRH